MDDLDEAGGIGELEQIIRKCNVLVVIMTDRYFNSRNCLRELRAAMAEAMPLVLVHETDPAHGGLSLEDMRAQCPEELQERVFSHTVVVWQRIGNAFQLESLRLIGEGLLPGSSLYIAGQPLHLTVRIASKVFASPYNASAIALADELVRETGEDTWRATARATAECFLLLLDSTVFDQPELVAEVAAAIDEHQKVVLVHDVSVEFADIIERTPPELRDQPPIGRGLYHDLAIPLMNGPHRRVSMHLVVQKLQRDALPCFATLAPACCCSIAGWLRDCLQRTSPVNPRAAVGSINAEPLLDRAS